MVRNRAYRPENRTNPVNWVLFVLRYEISLAQIGFLCLLILREVGIMNFDCCKSTYRIQFLCRSDLPVTTHQVDSIFVPDFKENPAAIIEQTYRDDGMAVRTVAFH